MCNKLCSSLPKLYIILEYVMYSSSTFIIQNGLVKFEFVILRNTKIIHDWVYKWGIQNVSALFCSLTKLKFHQTKLPILLTSKKLKMGAETFSTQKIRPST